MSASTFSRPGSHKQFPGEVAVTLSGYPAYPACSPYPSRGPIFVKEEPVHELVYPTSAKRRSPSYHPYLGTQEATRSPTRSKFPILGSTSHGPPSHDGGHSPTRPRTLEEKYPGYHPASWTHVHGDIPQGVSWEHQSRVALAAPVAHQGPTNCVLVPQGIFDAPLSASSIRLSSIPFRRVQFPELGIRVGDSLTESCLERAGINEFAVRATEKKLTFRIMWPGYEHFEFEVKSELCHFYTAQKLQIKMEEFKNSVKSGKTQVDHSSPAPQWKISTGPRDSGINLMEVVITKLIHRGGSYWQMELWAPSSRIAARY